MGRLAIGIATDICRYRFLSGPAFTLAVRISFRVGDHTDRAIGKNTSDFGQDMLAGSGTYKARFYVRAHGHHPPVGSRANRRERLRYSSRRAKFLFDDDTPQAPVDA